MNEYEHNRDELLEIEEKSEVREPSLYKVFLLNDDYTTMDFVVHILETVFHKPVPEATQIMLHVHKNGRGLAGVFTREIAETKIATVEKLAISRGFPLKCEMEED